MDEEEYFVKVTFYKQPSSKRVTLPNGRYIGSRKEGIERNSDSTEYSAWVPEGVVAEMKSKMFQTLEGRVQQKPTNSPPL